MATTTKNKKPNVFKRIAKFFRQVRLETKKVVWPTKQELINSTITVVVFCFVVGVIIAILDLVVGELIISRLLNLR